ncbi:hypothetical protein CspeluHIS016_0505860 [Cutaneotrichosporon spelunceum]|uniref:Enoyl-CoA hydratase n=1 Tax=Cutaneotrichosporon spelunceum TaxID=1672016 RepID=A0AAD3YE25_9TREE|nr:hypothetical protein CspeluHIS016_0505860 [Cutaneotrichosporon spelunceum]
MSPPPSYSSLPLTEVRVSNHPASAPGVTPIQVVTLYRPAAYNAFTRVMQEELVLLWNTFDADDRVKCIIMTGHGKMFCAGADLQQGFKRDMAGKINDHRDGGGRVALAIHQCRKPTIAAMQGSAVGVGMTMTLPMAIRVAYKGGKYGFPFARRGLVMEAASSFFLPKLVGHGRTMHLVSTGATYPADHALFDGLFTEVMDSPDAVLARALELAAEIVDNCSTVAWALMRDLVWRPTPSAEEQHLLDSRILYSMFSGADNNEGVQAFLEKRSVNFTGTMPKDAPEVYPWWPLIDTRDPVKDAKAKL